MAGAHFDTSVSAGALDTVSAGLVLDLGGARLGAERLLGERNAQRETVELTLPPSVLALEVGDAIEVDSESFEVTEIRDGVARRVVARAVLPEVEVTIAAARPGAGGDGPAARSVPVVTAAHLPPATDDIGHTRLALGAFARPWPGEVSVTAHAGDGRVRVEVVDDGTPFDPTAAAAPRTDLALDEREVGGLGIHLVRELMDDVRYERAGGRNKLSFSRSYDPMPPSRPGGGRAS